MPDHHDYPALRQYLAGKRRGLYAEQANAVVVDCEDILKCVWPVTLTSKKRQRSPKEERLMMPETLVGTPDPNPEWVAVLAPMIAKHLLRIMELGIEADRHEREMRRLRDG
jgi:hypothetical protein